MTFVTSPSNKGRPGRSADCLWSERQRRLARNSSSWVVLFFFFWGGGGGGGGGVPKRDPNVDNYPSAQ